MIGGEVDSIYYEVLWNASGVLELFEMRDVSSIIKDDKLLAARNNVYAGEDDVHFIFRTQDVFSLESVDIEVSVEGMSPKMFGL